ncbi:MAG TPA: serine/threonine-protein kinase [Kofleriaceae bacterium]|nr:serine/threonine-protein kinase [Kofleriaceae bacterium]
MKTVGADDRDLEPGQKVGEYVVEEKIGAGGFGTVFRGTHPLIGKLVAIKVLKRQYSADPEMVSRFVAEARAVNQIRHRNIIDIFAFGALEDGRHYYVMEYLDGLPLDEYLESVGRMPLGEAIPILRAVARALDAAHAKGIAHRDLKPENVFLARDPDGSIFPKLLDFGIAKLLGATGEGSMHKTRTGAPIGTPYYMSPEQCRGRDVDHRTDIYAFGVVAFKLLTGEVPFDGEDYMDILLKQIGEPPPAPSSRNEDLPASVDQGVLWMLAKDPSERPPNLVTAVRALEDAAQSAGIDFNVSQPSGVFAAPTAGGLAMMTPSGVKPLPQKAKSQPSFANAQTVDAARLSAVTDAEPSKRSALPLVLAILGAIAVGVVVFVLVKSGHKDDGAPAAADKPALDQGSAGGGGAIASDRGGSAIASGSAVTIGSGSAIGSASGSGESPTVPTQLSKLITIDIKGAPPNTQVNGPGGVILGVVPGPIQLERGDAPVVLTFVTDGYQPRSISVTPNVDAPLSVKLEKKNAGAGVKHGGGSSGSKGSGSGGAKGSGSGGHDTIEDPFHTGGN